jgi:hypothetical protein
MPRKPDFARVRHAGLADLWHTSQIDREGVSNATPHSRCLARPWRAGSVSSALSAAYLSTGSRRVDRRDVTHKPGRLSRLWTHKCATVMSKCKTTRPLL